MVKNSPQISATTHLSTEISTQNFSKNFCQLLSEHRHLCVNNPGVVERERSQTGLPGQQPPPRATCPDPRRPGLVETVQLCRCLIALPDPSPRWRRTVGPAQPCGVSPDVPHSSQRPPPNRAPTAGVWRQGLRPLRDLPTPEPHSGLCVVSPGDPATSGSLACRWRTAKPAVSRLGPSAQPPPGPLYVTSDRDAPAARHGPSRHRSARGSRTSFPSPCMEREMPAGQRVRSNACSPPAAGGEWGGHNLNPVGVVFLSLGQGEFNEPPP